VNGPHDLGGAHGFGAINPEANEPVFHSEWERRAAALSLAMNATGMWNIDIVRHARERIPPKFYVRSSYYEIWLRGLERLVVEHDLVHGAEFDAKRSLDPPKTLPRKPLAADVPALLAKGSRYDRPAESPALFAVGDKVRARIMNPSGHTRLPRYARGRNGTIASIHGAHVFPDSNAARRDENPQWLYSVAFDARELWGDEANSADEVLIDLWEPYLERR
jgi:nitrile hydratase subunit beta